MTGGAVFSQRLTGAIVLGHAFAALQTLLVIPGSYSLVYLREFRQIR
jgi:multidrug efflux pump subunit AcrB